MTQLSIISASGERGVRLSIEDRASGVNLVEVNLTPQQVFDLVRGMHQEVEGEITPHLDRIGKTMEHDTVTVPAEITRYWPRFGVIAEKRAQDWAMEHAPGWETYTARRNNVGAVNVAVRRWV